MDVDRPTANDVNTVLIPLRACAPYPTLTPEEIYLQHPERKEQDFKRAVWIHKRDLLKQKGKEIEDFSTDACKPMQIEEELVGEIIMAEKRDVLRSVVLASALECIYSVSSVSSPLPLFLSQLIHLILTD